MRAKFGVDPGTISCKGQAGALLDKLFLRRDLGLASERQLTAHLVDAIVAVEERDVCACGRTDAVVPGAGIAASISPCIAFAAK